MKRHIIEIILSLIILEYSRAIVLSVHQSLPEAEAEAAAENTDLSDTTHSNEEFFYEHTDEQGIERRDADKYWSMLLADNIFKDDTMELTGLIVDDMDDNGLNDLLVMIIDRENWAIHGAGCVWFYMNEDEPYCFDEEAGSYYGYFDFFAEDIDNDDNMELVLSTYGWGTGLEDTYKAVFKYKNHDLIRMGLPSDLDKDDDWGIDISVIQETDKNRYSAYCAYFDEEIFFEAKHVREPDGSRRAVGDNVGGFRNLTPIKYQGKNALQASEYLSGEGGTAHYVATAQFIILWDENGNSYVDRWWIETEENIFYLKI